MSHYWDEYKDNPTPVTDELRKKWLKACETHFKKEFNKECSGCEHCAQLDKDCFKACGVDMKFRHFRGDFNNSTNFGNGSAKTLSEEEAASRAAQEQGSMEDYLSRDIDESESSETTKEIQDLVGFGSVANNLNSGYDAYGDDN